MTNWEKKLDALADPVLKKRQREETRKRELEDEKDSFFEDTVEAVFKRLEEKLSSYYYEVQRLFHPEQPLKVLLQDGKWFTYEIEARRDGNKLVPFRTVKVMDKGGKELIDEEDCLASELSQVNDESIYEDFVTQFEKAQSTGMRGSHMGGSRRHGKRVF